MIDMDQEDGLDVTRMLRDNEVYRLASLRNHQKNIDAVAKILRDNDCETIHLQYAGSALGTMLVKIYKDGAISDETTIESLVGAEKPFDFHYSDGKTTKCGGLRSGCLEFIKDICRENNIDIGTWVKSGDSCALFIDSAGRAGFRHCMSHATEVTTTSILPKSGDSLFRQNLATLAAFTNLAPSVDQLQLSYSDFVDGYGIEFFGPDNGKLLRERQLHGPEIDAQFNRRMPYMYESAPRLAGARALKAVELNLREFCARFVNEALIQTENADHENLDNHGYINIFRNGEATLEHTRSWIVNSSQLYLVGTNEVPEMLSDEFAAQLISLGFFPEDCENARNQIAEAPAG